MNSVTAGLQARDEPAQRLHWPLIWTVVVCGLLYWGMHAQLERYITPKRGLGYWLGITGGSMMLLLLVYSARKRFLWLGWLGGLPAWFQTHMALGVVGPVLILFHSNFHLGASNSNVALVSMLLVAGSGVAGRYMYTRLYSRMGGHQQTLGQLRKVGDGLRTRTSSVEFLPGLVDAIERVENRLIVPPEGAALRLLHLLTGALRARLARWMVHREIRRAVARGISSNLPGRSAALIKRHETQICAVAGRYAELRLETGRRTAEYETYARLFSYWHVLHIPLFYMLLLSAIVHIIAVNLY